MSAVSLPVTRSSGRALVVSNPAVRAQLSQTLERLEYDCTALDDPYAAMAELCRQPLAYRAMILSLAGVYREELAVIRAVKRRYPQVEIWLAHTDGRQAALADAMRIGADGLLDEDGLHRVAVSPTAEQPDDVRAEPVQQAGRPDSDAARTEDAETAGGEPILTADELKALLQEQPTMPPAGDG